MYMYLRLNINFEKPYFILKKKKKKKTQQNTFQIWYSILS